MKVQWTKPSYPLTLTCVFYLTGWILDRKLKVFASFQNFHLFCDFYLHGPHLRNFFCHFTHMKKRTISFMKWFSYWIQLKRQTDYPKIHIEQFGFLIALILKLFIHCVVNSSGLQLRRRAALLARVFFFRQIGGGTAELAHSSAK